MTASDVPGVRERRKQLTREDLLHSARELFADRGYDNVTVAEVAAGAGVTAKTVFQHFGSKEDLLLGVLEGHHERLLQALRERAAGQTPLAALTEWLLASSGDGRPDGLERFQRTVGSSAAVAALRRRLYEEWENAIVRVLAAEGSEEPATPRTRLVAAQLISMVRVMSSPEVLEYVGRFALAERKAARAQYIAEAAQVIGAGVDHTPGPIPD